MNNVSDFPEFVSRVNTDLPDAPMRQALPDLGSPGAAQPPAQVAFDLPDTPAPGRPELPAGLPGTAASPGMQLIGDTPAFAMPQRVNFDLPEIQTPGRPEAGMLPTPELPSGPTVKELVQALPPDFIRPPRADDYGFAPAPPNTTLEDHGFAPEYVARESMPVYGPEWQVGRLPPEFGRADFSSGLNTSIRPMENLPIATRPVVYF